MTPPRNILWIMCDQLRFDYLGCAGHPTIRTPNIDALAARGVRFTRAYVQSPVCGPARMSFYTGRYMRSHGSNWNQYPLRVGEPTLGEPSRTLGVRPVLVGKTHMRADTAGMARLGIDPGTDLGVRIAQCGFEPFDRDDGLHPGGRPPTPAYNDYLRAHGFGGDNPWHDWANSAEGPDGEIRSGWLLVHADKPARVPRGTFRNPLHDPPGHGVHPAAPKQDGRPWCLHLSYIKPHWPYIAPAPYHAMYTGRDIIPPVRSDAERTDPHPVYRAFMNQRASRNFSRDEVRERVIPAYMGLITQIDDQLGLLFRFLDQHDLTRRTMIVFTSDHGDYLGDHWMGEKDLFHEVSVKIPLIIADPSPPADATRGTTCDALVESIDLAPSFVEWFGGNPPSHILEGRSLLPFLHGTTPAEWRRHVFSEYDYAMQEARLTLHQPIPDCRLFMVFDGRWKMIHAPGFRPMLYDLATDPDEFHDLGADPRFTPEILRLRDALLDWALRDHNRITISDAEIAPYAGRAQLQRGIFIGYWDETEVAEARRRASAASP